MPSVGRLGPKGKYEFLSHQLRRPWQNWQSRTRYLEFMHILRPDKAKDCSAPAKPTL